MALITCPNCGEQISDKAKTCVHCGALMQLEEKRVCEECGTELEEEMEVCPSCGCPVANSEKESSAGPQQVEVTGVRMTTKMKKIAMITGLSIVMIIAIVLAVGQICKRKAANEAEKATKEYGMNLNTITYSMLDACSDAEKCGNLIESVWSNAIYKERDNETDEYTMSNGSFVSDFNDALHKLFADSSFSQKVDDISEKQESVDALMKKMKNPPSKYKEAYEKMQDFYDAYIALTGMATDPSGSLQTYSTSFQEADTEALNCYNAMKVYLEE